MSPRKPDIPVDANPAIQSLGDRRVVSITWVLHDADQRVVRTGEARWDADYTFQIPGSAIEGLAAGEYTVELEIDHDPLEDS